MVLFTGCEASTDPLDGVGGGPPPGGAITQAQASGDWVFTLDRTNTTACSPGSLPDNQLIVAHLDVISNGTNTGSLLGTTSGWRPSPSTTLRGLDGGLLF